MNNRPLSGLGIANQERRRLGALPPVDSLKTRMMVVFSFRATINVASADGEECAAQQGYRLA